MKPLLFLIACTFLLAGCAEPKTPSAIKVNTMLKIKGVDFPLVEVQINTDDGTMIYRRKE